jgi:hypothetical protein
MHSMVWRIGYSAKTFGRKTLGRKIAIHVLKITRLITR